MKIAVILAGSGVYDGSEIHESVLSLLAIAELGHEANCFAPNKNQLHVINHLDGSVMDENRNVLIESARIARGDISDLKDLDSSNFDALLIPGGFGAAKNLNQWAVNGPDCTIDTAVKNTILQFIAEKKPIAALCMGPTVIAKALEGSPYSANLTVGSSKASSPYDIQGIAAGMEQIGAVHLEKTIQEVAIDVELKIVSAPCYMMDASIVELHENIKMAVEELTKLNK
mgnify:CR=1 FL=1